ncbi:MAG: efflux transporter periplasmic adaptor subunit, partial [Bacteroidaceae bacterium]|nr:efflux transporter periplasmic adaptor subunit [Bacteroidaceae bacterium]
MDIQLKRRPWYIRHKYYLLLGIAIAAITVINIIIMTGPSTHIVESDDIEYAEAKNDDFLEYIDVEGVVQPILNIKVSSGEGGYVSRVVASD